MRTMFIMHRKKFMQGNDINQLINLYLEINSRSYFFTWVITGYAIYITILFIYACTIFIVSWITTHLKTRKTHEWKVRHTKYLQKCCCKIKFKELLRGKVTKKLIGSLKLKIINFKCKSPHLKTTGKRW